MPGTIFQPEPIEEYNVPNDLFDDFDPLDLPQDMSPRVARMEAFQKKLDVVPLMEQLMLARKAGLALKALFEEFHIAIDITDEGHFRIEEGTLVLLVPSALQEARLRQLQQRILSQLHKYSLPITDVKVRQVPVTLTPSAPSELPPIERPRSAIASAQLASIVSELSDPGLKTSIARLSEVLKPSPETMAEDLSQTIGELTNKNVQKQLELKTAIEQLDDELGRNLSPEEFDRLEASSSGGHIPDWIPGARAKVLEKMARRALLAEDLAQYEATLGQLQNAIAQVEEHPEQSANYLVETVFPVKEKEPERAAVSTPPTSLRAHLALEALLSRTQNRALRHSLETLSQTLAPQDETQALRQLITEELEELNRTLVALPTHEPRALSQIQTISARISELSDALWHLEDTDNVHSLALKLYAPPNLDEDEPEAEPPPETPKRPLPPSVVRWQQHIAQTRPHDRSPSEKPSSLATSPEHEPSEDSQPTPSTVTSLRGHLALEALIDKTYDTSLRRSLITLSKTLAPANMKEALVTLIQAELHQAQSDGVSPTAQAFPPPTPERLTQLVEALEALASESCDARTLALRLYAPPELEEPATDTSTAKTSETPPLEP